jgi:hypothetical protein
VPAFAFDLASCHEMTELSRAETVLHVATVPCATFHE